MVPPVGEIPPSAASLARLIFGDKAPSLGKSKSKSSSASQGSKRKASEAASSQNVASTSASSSTPVAERISIPSEDTIPSQDDASGTDASGFDGCDVAMGHDAAANQSQDEDVIIIDNDDATPAMKRRKKCTSDVWQYFTKKQEIVEIDGRKYIQVWGHCNFPRCKAKYRAEGHQGTSGFRNHLKSAHSIVKGQLCLKTEKDHVKDITTIEPYKYDQEWEELMKHANECGLDTTKGLSHDVSTRWNSTYMMLRGALYYKSAFLRLKSSDRRRYDKICPSADEWNMALTLFQCLKKFYDLIELLFGTSYPTANLFYRGFYEIKELLDKWCVHEDLIIRQMATAMSAKFEKYWNKSSTALAVACFFDPRYKKRLIEFYMKRFHSDLYQIQLEEFVSVIKKLYQFYINYAPSKIKSNAVETSTTDDILMEDQDKELESFLYDTNDHDLGDLNELEKYMAEPLLKHSGQFDILSWWRSKIKEYPILTQIARDVLEIQVSTVASESAFSAGGRVIDPYRSRLDPEMVEALICTKDWVAASRKDSKHFRTMIDDLEVLEVVTAALKHEDENEDGTKFPKNNEDGASSDRDVMGECWDL